MFSTDDYARRAAAGFIRSMDHYGNSSPACGDGRVSTPAYYANMLGKVLNAKGDRLPTSPRGEWWGWRWMAYAEQILAA
ncbi:hypothetical protein I5G67_gp082 [Mycobacterium phage Aminay]|uniref:Uncharacterized protein n=1 Tax=Mycobacterium phage Aminay TaxID=2250291 RepID=A0A345KV66_9CAUD|nr:hypothetical protein I5G67_gp082 [Mycobacterium phage Aminay]AXH46918.1 hypothetical protein SEA_AMINAY_82 [Mycobacterium phage Aminay]